MDALAHIKMLHLLTNTCDAHYAPTKCYILTLIVYQ